VIVALGGPWPIGPATVSGLEGGGTIVVDVSVPVAAPRELARRLGRRWITADDLATISVDERDPGAAALTARVDTLIDQTVSAFADWSARRDGRAAADALVRRAELEREQELAALWRRLPNLDGDTRIAIEGMTRHLAARLLRQPLERLGRDGDGQDGRAVRELFGL
jgi:glutamyl-tRNA reductase